MVVARQGDVALTLLDIDAFASTIPEAQRSQVFNDPNGIEKILRGLLMNKQMAAEARQKGLDDDPLIKARVERAEEQELAKVDTEAVKKELESRIPDMDELARERYLAHPDQYAVPASIDVKHILISTKERSDADAKALADKLYNELNKDPSKFDAYVEKYSDDPSKARNHGLIEDASSARLVQSFRAAASNMHKVGAITEPVKSPYGYHIIKAIKIKPAQPRSFAQVKPDLVKKLRSDWLEQKLQDHLDAMRSRKIEPNPDLIASLRDRYARDKTGEPAPSTSSSKP